MEGRHKMLKYLGMEFSLNADILCEGHYGVYRGRREIEKLIRSFMRGYP
jgi:hypothetical protein